MKFLIAFVLTIVACGNESDGVIVDEYLSCKDFCGDVGVKEYSPTDSGYLCMCNKQTKN